MKRLRGRAAVIRVDRFEDIREAAATANCLQIRLRCILAESDVPLSHIPYQESWANIPIALYAASLGNFRRFADQIGLFRRLNIRAYLPTHSADSYAHIRMLSSLGIETAILFDDRRLDWDKMGDLMTYALWGFARHSQIEPFSFIARNYKNTEKLNFAGVYFDDPAVFLHLDNCGNAALTRQRLLSGDTFPLNLDDPFSGDYIKEFKKHEATHREFFLREEGCAYCPGWRICLGKFSHLREVNAGCGSFFSDLLDSVERYQDTQSSKAGRWQP